MPYPMPLTPRRVVPGDTRGKKIPHLSSLPASHPRLEMGFSPGWGPNARKLGGHSEHLWGPSSGHAGYQPRSQEGTVFKRVTLLWGSERQNMEHGEVYWNNSASLLSVPNLGMVFGNSHFLITIATSGGQGNILVLYDSFEQRGRCTEKGRDLPMLLVGLW